MLYNKIKWAIQDFGFLFNRHKASKKPNILLFSMPRSGSTWLCELIWSQPKFKAINEPLYLKRIRLQKKSNISGFSELYTEQVKEKVISYFKGFVDGKYHFLNPNPLRKNSKFFTSRVIFKVIHGGELLINDLAKETNSKVVFLIRNPIAVALSRNQLKRTEELVSNYVMNHFSKEEKNYARKMMREGNEMEKKVLTWCIQNKLALMYKTQDWLLLSYETLTCNPTKALTALAEHCQLPDYEGMLKSVNIPSGVSTQSNKDTVKLMKEDHETRKKLISKWRKKVSPEEMKSYFEICKQMNMEYYTAKSDFVSNSEFI